MLVEFLQKMVLIYINLRSPFGKDVEESQHPTLRVHSLLSKVSVSSTAGTVHRVCILSRALDDH